MNLLLTHRWMIVAALCSSVEEPPGPGFQLVYVKQNLVVVLYLRNNLVRKRSAGPPVKSARCQ